MTTTYQVGVAINEYSYLSFTILFGTLAFMLLAVDRYRHSTDIDMLRLVIHQSQELKEIREDQHVMSENLTEIKELTKQIANSLLK